MNILDLESRLDETNRLNDQLNLKLKEYKELDLDQFDKIKKENVSLKLDLEKQKKAFMLEQTRSW